MMARFRRKSSAAKEDSSTGQSLNSGPRFAGSHLDPPSPEELNWPPTPPLIAEGQRKSSLNSLISIWSNPSSSLVVETKPASIKSRHIPIDISKYQTTTSPTYESFQEHATKPTKPTRLPRYVPIIIPEFAHPFAQQSRSDKDPACNISPVSPRTRPSESQLDDTSDEKRAPASPAPSEFDVNAFPIPNNSKATMNNSQVSLVASEASNEGADNFNVPLRKANGGGGTGGGNIGISPGVPPPGTAPSNLSNLVCNVHRTTGEEPHALVGATTTILGDKLYVFGGRLHSRTRPQLTSDLFELDLIKRHWVKIDATGDVPPPRYFHSVCALGDMKLVCYGGMSPAVHNRNGTSGQADAQPEVVVMSDIHVFDVSTRTWTLIATSDNPQGRYAHCAAILPSSAAFTSANAPLSAIQHNPPSSDPHSGTLGVQLDGTGGAEMIVVGGQDSNNNYIEQISVFNLRSLKWTNTTSWDRKCGAYKSMVAPMPGISAELIGRGSPLNDSQSQRMSSRPGTSMLIYSNYNFLDVKLELQIRMPDGSLVEKPMTGSVSPPGLRFPNGGIIDGHFVVSGTYLTSSKHEYALWALDLKTLTWARIDTNGSIFSQGSWNRGILWNRRNTFVILGHRKRSLVDDYNHRRINFSHVCMVELEAFGLYDNPRKLSPTSGYVSASSPAVPISLQSLLPSQSAGGRPFTTMAEQLGQAALSLSELADMEIVALGGEKIPCNSYLLSRRWGPFFNQLLLESATTHESASMSDAATLRPNARIQASRNSSVTITPSAANGLAPSTVGASGDSILDPQRSLSRSTTRTLVELPNPTSVPASSRPRSLYLPHMAPTVQLLLQYLYTSALPPAGSNLCTPHTLCSLLQMARPYQVDGLIEATVERLHEVLDGRNSAAVFNAAAMAAGGGRGLGGAVGGTLAALGRRESEATTIGDQSLASKTSGQGSGPIQEEMKKRGHQKSSSVDSASTATSVSTSTDISNTDNEASPKDENADPNVKGGEAREKWSGDLSSVIGLQKRGLRGLMEGRRLRERANTGGGGGGGGGGES